MRAFLLEISARLHDLCKQRKRWLDVYRPNDYSHSQKLGRRLWKEGSSGILYFSVRGTGGRCAALFSPTTIRSFRLGNVLEYGWDGQKIAEVYELKKLR